MLVLVTLGALERRALLGQRKRRTAEPGPEPTPVCTGRATIVEVATPFESTAEAQAWLEHAGDAEAQASLELLNRVLHAFRVVTANPYVNAVTREQTLVARVGFGAGEEVSDGQWAQARELVTISPRQRRVQALAPQARLAAVLGGRERALACQELTLRARLDLDHGRGREAALQLLVALDAALAELATDPTAPMLSERLSELRVRRDAVTVAAQAALAGPLERRDQEIVESTLGRIEAALRARAVALA